MVAPEGKLPDIEVTYPNGMTDEELLAKFKPLVDVMIEYARTPKYTKEMMDSIFQIVPANNENV
jgi:hypothetical protein